MQYVCLMYCEPAFFDRLSPEEQKAFDREAMASDRELKRNGHLLQAKALQSAKSAVTVRIRDKKISATDGPFAETKEHLCGFILIEAASLDEAVQIASRGPFAKHGSVEVRPVYHVPEW